MIIDNEELRYIYWTAALYYWTDSGKLTIALDVGMCISVGRDVGMCISIRSCSGVEGLVQIELIVMKLWLWRMALRRASKHYFPSFSIFKPAKREKGRNASDDSFLSMFTLFSVMF